MIPPVVTVTVDRPMGSYHPQYPDLYYPINYGYVAGIPAPDGEDQDAYILGVDNPLKAFTGKVVAVIHRENDVETKWVVAPEHLDLTEAEIQSATHFQEQYFISRIQML